MQSTSPKPFVFVLMPFGSSFDDVYQFGIKAACQDAETYCERLDEQIFHENMLDRIYNQISKADIVIADMSGRNPNVFYEVGYAHALGKIVILLTNNGDDIPFDLKHYPHLIYAREKLSSLKTALFDKVNYFRKTRGAQKKFQPNLKFYINHTELVNNAIIFSTYIETINELERRYYRVIKLDFSIQNISNSKVKPPSKIALYTDKALYKYTHSPLDDYDYIDTPHGQSVIALYTGRTLLPEDWMNYQIEIAYDVSSPQQKQFELEIKIYLEDQLIKIPCKLNVSR